MSNNGLSFDGVNDDVLSDGCGRDSTASDDDVSDDIHENVKWVMDEIRTIRFEWKVS